MKNAKRLMSVVMWMSFASLTAMAAQDKPAAAPMGGGTMSGMPAMPMMQMMQTMQDCPMSVAGTEVAAADTPTGIALSMTTKIGNIDELRRRAERMADMHASPAEGAASMPGMMMQGNAKYEAIPNGALLTLTPRDPAQLTEFRKLVQSRVEHMASMESRCSNMQGMMRGMMMGANPDTNKGESDVDHSAHHPAEKP